MFRNQKRILLLFIILSTFSVAFSQYFCNKKIYDPDKSLTMDQIKEICTRIKTKKIIVSIQKQLNGSSFYEDTRRNFSTLCGPLKMCRSGVMISIYINNRKSLIYVGSKIKMRISISKRKEIMSKEKDLFAKGDYYNSILNIINSINNEVSTNYLFTNNRNPNMRRRNVYRDSNNLSLTTILLVIFFVIFLLFLIICICVLMKKEEESEKAYDHGYHVRENDEDLKEHMRFLNKILYDISRTSSKSLNIDFCLLCMENFVAYKDNFNTTVRRFECGHLFHYQCIYNYNECLLCKGLPQQQFTQINSQPQNSQLNQFPQQNIISGSNINNNIMNYPYFNSNPFLYTVTEQQIINFIHNFRLIYDEEELRMYYKENTREVEHMSQEHGVPLWGLAAGVAAGAAVGGLIGYGIGSHVNSGHEAHHIANTNPNSHADNYANFKDEEEEDDFDGDAAEQGW
jgi:hypothetical protein